jgi:nicotinate-nucleotide adenylyltransferase
MLIGLFGGTFDPPHLGHLALCQEAIRDLPLDRLLWLLTPNPPHKPNGDITPLPHRLAMVNLSLEGTPFELSRLDIDRPGPHYAVDTVNILAGENPGAKLLYLMGSDSLNDLPTWHPDLSSLEELLPGLTDKVRFIEAPRVDISARMVRALVQSGKPFEHLVPAGVAQYIREHRLYQSPNPHSSTADLRS